MEPIKGIGPKSALKLLREHGSLAAVLEHLREKCANKLFNVVGLSFILFFRAAEREEREEHAEEGKKKKGGVLVPEEWPWEAAKKLFQQPDVIPADQVEVGVFPLLPHQLFLNEFSS